MVGRIAILRLPEIATRLKRSVNHPLTVLCNGVFSTRIPGFKYDDFDRAGYVNFAKVNKMFEMNRMIDEGFSSVNGMKGLLFNVFGRRFTFSRALYERAAIDFPMTLRWSASRLGLTSVDFSQTLEETATGTVLASGGFRVVNIDPMMQKSRPLPDEVRQKLTEMLSPGDQLTLLAPPNLPPGHATFSCHVRVRHDDMDMLFHANQGSYFSFVRECAAQATSAGFYTWLANDDDIAFRLAHVVAGVYFGESFVGDELEVVTWEDLNDHLLLHFVVRKDGQTIYYSTVKYFNS